MAGWSGGGGGSDVGGGSGVGGQRQRRVVPTGAREELLEERWSGGAVAMGWRRQQRWGGQWRRGNRGAEADPAALGLTGGRRRLPRADSSGRTGGVLWQSVRAHAKAGPPVGLQRGGWAHAAAWARIEPACQGWRSWQRCLGCSKSSRSKGRQEQPMGAAASLPAGRGCLAGLLDVAAERRGLQLSRGGGGDVVMQSADGQKADRVLWVAPDRIVAFYAYWA